MAHVAQRLHSIFSRESELHPNLLTVPNNKTCPTIYTRFRQFGKKMSAVFETNILHRCNRMNYTRRCNNIGNMILRKLTLCVSHLCLKTGRISAHAIYYMFEHVSCRPYWIQFPVELQLSSSSRSLTIGGQAT